MPKLAKYLGAGADVCFFNVKYAFGAKGKRKCYVEALFISEH